MALALLAGCSQPENRHPVFGKVLVNGRPAARARVIFVPVAGSPLRPSAETQADGSFELSGKGGVPVGEYAVTIVWPVYEINGGEEIQKGDRLRGRYDSLAKAFTKVTIQTGRNDLNPFALSAP